jgi:Rad3-related DNA helicase
LGQIKNLIIDEAHNLEDATTDALTKEFSLKSLEESLNKILTTLKKSNFFIDNLDKKFDYIYSHISLLFDLLIDYTLKKNTF